MIEPQVSENDAGPSTSASASADRLRSRLKLFGGIFASIAAVGAIAGGLAGYVNAWRAVRSFLDPVAHQDTLHAPPVITGGPTVAVLPFANSTGDPSLETFADGLTQGMIGALGNFSALRVLAHNTTASYKGPAVEPVDLARQLGVDYLIEGDLRKGGETIRVTISLVDAHSGAQVWWKPFSVNTGGDLLASQDEITGRASGIVGSWHNGIAAAEFIQMRTKTPEVFTPYECVVLGTMVGPASASEESITRGRTCLEALTKKEPANFIAWAALASVYLNQRDWGFGLPPEQANRIEKRAYLVDSALHAATKAVDIAPNDALTRRTLAMAYRGLCQSDRMRSEGKRAIELNPNDANILGQLGGWIAFSGDWAVGVPMAEKAIEILAPANPRWYWWAVADRNWISGDYQGAYDALQNGWVEQNWFVHLSAVYMLSSLGRLDDAKAEIAALLKIHPGFTIRDADAQYRMFCFNAAYREKMAGALRRAGLPE